MSEVVRLTTTAAMIWQGEACPRGHGDDYQQPQRTTPSNCFNLAASENGLPAFGEARYRADARQRPGSEQTAGAEDDGTPAWRAVLGHGQYGQWGNLSASVRSDDARLCGHQREHGEERIRDCGSGQRPAAGRATGGRGGHAMAIAAQAPSIAFPWWW